MEKEILQEIVKLIRPIFGEATARVLEKNFADENPETIVNMAHKMLSDFMGEENANKMLGSVLKKFPKLKIELKVD